MRNKSVVTEAKEINMAVELVQLGARLQVLEAETSISRERLLKLYKDGKVSMEEALANADSRSNLEAQIHFA